MSYEQQLSRHNESRNDEAGDQSLDEQDVLPATIIFDFPTKESLVWMPSIDEIGHAMSR